MPPKPAGAIRAGFFHGLAVVLLAATGALMAAEPTSSAATGAIVVAALSSALGPVLGTYAVIVVCALAGGFVAVTGAQTASLAAGALAMVRGAVVAAVAAGMLAQAAASATGAVIGDILGPVAFLIGWRTDWALGWLQSRFGGDGNAR